MRIPLLAVAIVLWCLGSLGQERTLHTGARLVIAPTTVKDRAGHYINGLKESDFELYDNGTAQRVNADIEFIPISLVIAIQTSDTSVAALNKIHKIGSMLEPLVTGEDGQAAVVTFDDEV